MTNPRRGEIMLSLPYNEGEFRESSKDSSVDIDCYPTRKSKLYFQLSWIGVSCGDKWPQAHILGIKWMFGEHVPSYKGQNMIHELRVCL